MEGESHTAKPRYTLSVRGKPTHTGITAFLETHYSRFSRESIDSVFGFVERSTLYGGRIFSEPELSDADVLELYRMGIGVRLPLTNKYVNRAEYETNRQWLSKYHRAGNAVIVVNDKLAGWIRDDFPLFRIEGSVIKNIHSKRALERALETYDDVILPAKSNDDIKFLESIERKESVTLFANAGCAYTCPASICYAHVSRLNKHDGANVTVPACSKSFVPRRQLGMVEFDLEKYMALGFTRFKVLRTNPRSEIPTGY